MSNLSVKGVQHTVTRSLVQNFNYFRNKKTEQQMLLGFLLISDIQHD